MNTNFEINPIQLREEFKTGLRSFYETALPVSDRFPELKKAIHNSLSEESRTIKGPFLETLPDFRKGKSIRQLVAEKLLHPGFLEMEKDIVDRPLHSHQEEALRKVIGKEENAIVATGTGSGKTECFLYPLLNSLLKEWDESGSQPGVKAIIVYPMNALANDQLYHRLVPLFCKTLRDYGITLGRYTGETHSTQSRGAIEKILLRDPYFKKSLGWNNIPANWLLSRKEMLLNPPNVLVTNYAMLEHILLFPRNKLLLDGASISHLILDEIHTYSGAQATEVACLLRKLKQKYTSNSNPRCIGTSASLPNDANEQTLEFAGRLFGENFSGEQATVIQGERLPHRLLHQSKESNERFTPREWSRLYELISTHLPDFNSSNFTDTWNSKLIPLNLEKAQLEISTEETFQVAYTRRFSKDPDIRKVSDMLLSQGTSSFRDIASQLFPQIEIEIAEQALAGIVLAGSVAKESPNAFALLPARYHYFLNTPDDLTVRPTTETAECWTDLEHNSIFQDEDGRMRYRLLTCRSCGELYLEGYDCNGYVLPNYPKGDSDRVSKAIIWLNPPKDLNQDEDQISIPAYLDLENPRMPKLATTSPDNLQSGTFLECRKILPMETIESSEDGHSCLGKQCPSCGETYNFGELKPLTRFRPADQPVGEVITDILYKHLSGTDDPAEARKLPAQGRNLLVFTDNRQDAAFFAARLNASARDKLLRSLSIKTLKDPNLDPIERAPSLSSLATRLQENDVLRPHESILDEMGEGTSEEDDRRQELLGWLMGEFCRKKGGRMNLEALGLVDIGYGKQFRNLIRENDFTDSLGTSHAHLAENFLKHILDYIRRNRAIKMLPGIDPNREWIWSRSYARSDISALLDVTENNSTRIIPADGKNNPLRDLLDIRLGIPGWKNFLVQAWELMTDEDYRILVPVSEGSPAYVINTRALEIRYVSPEEMPLFQCDTCSILTTRDLDGCCPSKGCKGKMKRLSMEEVNHFRKTNYFAQSYTNNNPLPLNAKEHTAALSPKIRQNLEYQFKAGKVNLLSCSTTMEMGIDLGDLESVFLRNVPPGIANYEQRAGRAGRRAQAVPVCVTYAKNSRWDRAVFDNAGQFLRSKPKTPHVHLANPQLFLRHQFSILMGYWMDYLGLDESSPQLGRFFKLDYVNENRGDIYFRSGEVPIFSETDMKAYLEEFQEWMEGEGNPFLVQASELTNYLMESLQPGELSKLKVSPEKLSGEVFNQMASFTREFYTRYNHYSNPDNSNKRSETARGLAAEKKAARFAIQKADNYMIRHGLLPSYTFPIDNIQLEVKKESRKTNLFESDEILDRDARRAITEYAPGAEVVCNGRIWTSRGVGYYPRHFMPQRRYKTCKHCRHLEIAESDTFPKQCPSCQRDWSATPSRPFIEPRSFTTALDESKGRPVRESRDLPPPSQEEQLLTRIEDRAFAPKDGNASWAAISSREAQLLVVNKGYNLGYAQCSCGYATQSHPNRNYINQKHNNPFTGKECRKEDRTWKTHDFAHEFRTDILSTRLNIPIPTPQVAENSSLLEPSPIAFQKQILRTISEAMRLAMATELNTDEREIGATYKLHDKPEIILFDTVPGGAGYVTGYHSQYTPWDLLKLTLNVLDCQYCTEGCSHCIQSYSNQRYWDDFKRKEAAEYLRALLANQPDSDSQMEKPTNTSQNPSSAISIEQLNEQLQTSDEIFLCANTLLPASIDNLEGLEQILDLLEQGKSITIGSTEDSLKALIDPHQPATLQIARQLGQHTEDGTLKFVSFDRKDLIEIPRIQSRFLTNLSSLIAKSDVPLFESLNPGQLHQEQTGQTQFYTETNPEKQKPWQLQFPSNLTLREYEEGKPRFLGKDFHFLENGSPSRILIISPDILKTESNLSALKNLCRYWTDKLGMNRPPVIEVRTLELAPHIQQYAQRSLKSFLEEQFPGSSLHITPLRPQHTDKCSRIEFDLKEAKAGNSPLGKRPGKKTTSTRYRVTLDKGIPGLIDNHQSCTVLIQKV